MDKTAFIKIRKCLKKTQRELSVLLGVSLKGVQSFEQGWRNIPAHVERQMIFLAVMKDSGNEMKHPCWKVKKCSEEVKRNCPAWEFQAKRFCWMTNGLICQGKVHDSWEKKMDICMGCSIFRSEAPQVAILKEGGEPE